VIGFLLSEFAEKKVESGVDDADALDVVQRRFSLFKQRLKR
jgi:hypothetical protein